MTEYPLNEQESHEYLQQRQGWSVAAMRSEMDAMHQVIEKQKRQLALYEICFSNALNCLLVVNCANEDQAKVNFAIEQLKDIKRVRASNSPEKS